MQKIVVNLEKAKRNFEIIKSFTKKRIICVVKSDAYGHGAEKLAPLYQALGADAFAVCDVEEAILLRNFGIKKDILVAGYTPPSEIKNIANYRLTQSLISYDYAKAVNRECERLGIEISGHIKIDTGMHRFGIPFTDKGKIAEVFNMKNLLVKGVYTHYARADESSKSSFEDMGALSDPTLKQYNAFLKAIKPYSGVFTHTSNSAAFANYPNLKEDGVRVGLSLYGFGGINGLTPIMEYRTKIVHIEMTKKGDAIGYGGTYVCKNDGVIGVIPIGYANGFCPSTEYGDYFVRVKNHPAKVIGRVCMNHTFIDLSEMESLSDVVEVGDTVTVAESTSDFLNLARSQNYSVYRTLTTLGSCNKKEYR